MPSNFYATSSLENKDIRDLNKVRINVDGGSGSGELIDYSIPQPNGYTLVHFRDLAEHLMGYIAQADLIVGCVAWLTHDGLLDALSKVPEGVALVVQKEDFLRPDTVANPFKKPRDYVWRSRLRKKYAALKGQDNRCIFPGRVCECSTNSYCEIDAVRCVGNYNEEKNPAFPRMHNKFLVFCRYVVSKEPTYMEPTPDFDGEENEKTDSPDMRIYYEPSVEPYAVWTGSFNLTHNATCSLENALYLTQPDIVRAYYLEWSQSKRCQSRWTGNILGPHQNGE